MTIKRRVIKGSSMWPSEDIVRFYSRQEVINKAKHHAAQLWKLLVEKLGARLAREIMHEIMGDKKPGPRQTDEQKALNKFIRDHISASDSDQSDEQIAKRILKGEPHYLQRNPFTIDDLRDMAKRIGIDVHDDDLRDELRDQSAVDVVSRKFMKMTLNEYPKSQGRRVGKGLAALEKQVGGIRRKMIEEGSLPKAYAPRPYRRG
jgi:hypothetical protein